MTTRRGLLAGAAFAGAAAVTALGTDKAFAAGQTGAFAPAPSGKDDTAVIKDAAAYGKILGPGTYRMSGPIDLNRFSLIGIPGKTAIYLEGTGCIDSSDTWGVAYASGIYFEGSAATKNVIRCKSKNTDVAEHKVFENLVFRNYSKGGIVCNQIDNPYVKVRNCQFSASNDTSAYGVVLAGGTDMCELSNCSFLVNKTHVVVGGGGDRMKIFANDFLRFKSGSSRTDIWVIPSKAIQGSGAGLSIKENKFGNENRNGASDICIIYADASNPTANAEDWKLKWGSSEGYVVLQEISSNDFSGAGRSTTSPILSWTKNMLSNRFGPNMHSGTSPKFEVEYLGAKPTSYTDNWISGGQIWWAMRPDLYVKPSNADSKTFKTV